ncbi:hypothetical protein BC332_27846 [Capsicum chinense]|nr:hypothetical protein BC332_27846 [Capsicum chinense]
MFIKIKISDGICGSVEQHNNVKALLKAIDEQFETSDKTLASTFIMKFSSMRLTCARGVCEHIMKRLDLAAQLKTLEICKERILLHLEYMNIDYAIRKDESHIDETSTQAEIALYE